MDDYMYHRQAAALITAAEDDGDYVYPSLGTLFRVGRMKENANDELQCSDIL